MPNRGERLTKNKNIEYAYYIKVVAIALTFGAIAYMLLRIPQDFQVDINLLIKTLNHLNALQQELKIDNHTLEIVIKNPENFLSQLNLPKQLQKQIIEDRQPLIIKIERADLDEAITKIDQQKDQTTKSDVSIPVKIGDKEFSISLRLLLSELHEDEAVIIVPYTIAEGDTLSEIAREFNTTITEIMELNPSITDSNMIYSGQVLLIPIQIKNYPSETAKPEPESPNSSLHDQAKKILVKKYGRPRLPAVNATNDDGKKGGRRNENQKKVKPPYTTKGPRV